MQILRFAPEVSPPRVIAAVAALVLAASCGPHSIAEQRADRASRASGDVVIGVAWPWQARRELRFGDGLDMAVAEINASGGIDGRHIRLEKSDDHESADDGRAVAQKFDADPNVVAVIGHLQSYVSVPAASIYDNGGLVMVAPAATDPELTSLGYRRVFRATFTDKAVGHRMADFAAARGYRRVAIEYVRNTYGRDLSNAFEEHAVDLGLTIAARESYGAEATTADTFDPTVREWKTLGIDAIFLAGEVPSAAYFVTSARRSGLTVPIIGGDALGTGALMSIAGAAAEGTIVPSVFHPDEPRAEVERFDAAFRRRFNAVPDAGSALGYDAVNLLAAAMKQAHSVAPDRVATALHHLHDWRGVTGTFAFDSTGDLGDRPMVTMVVHNGRFEYMPAPQRLTAMRRDSATARSSLR
ncbi:MAG TPA: ABC transporter substrate-binding protein [Gemmatimonadaceae bacterium]|nr:ABC transporter substrate-binding protein [Gemmatimonadaceae bacterium]